MEMTLKQKIVQHILDQTEKTAETHATNFCRYWIGVEKVPTKLLEPEFQNKSSEN